MSWQAQKIKSLQARTRFNETVRPYNNHIKILNSVFAGMFGFKNHTL
jgi:hypothetical protein